MVRCIRQGLETRSAITRAGGPSHKQSKARGLRGGIGSNDKSEGGAECWRRCELKWSRKSGIGVSVKLLGELGAEANKCV